MNDYSDINRRSRSNVLISLVMIILMLMVIVLALIFGGDSSPESNEEGGEPTEGREEALFRDRYVYLVKDPPAFSLYASMQTFKRFQEMQQSHQAECLELNTIIEELEQENARLLEEIEGMNADLEEINGLYSDSLSVFLSFFQEKLGGV